MSHYRISCDYDGDAEHDRGISIFSTESIWEDRLRQRDGCDYVEEMKDRIILAVIAILMVTTFVILAIIAKNINRNELEVDMTIIDVKNISEKVGNKTDNDKKDKGDSGDSEGMDNISYRDLQIAEVDVEESDIKEIKLREELKVPESLIGETLPDSEYNICEGNETKMKEIEEREGIKNDAEDDFEYSIFLYDFDQYIRTDLIRDGYGVIYYMSENNGNDIDASRVVKSLKIRLESLEDKNRLLREKFSGDAELISVWDSCYKELMKAGEVLDKINEDDVSNIYKYSREVDINSLHKTSSSLGVFLGNRLDNEGTG